MTAKLVTVPAVPILKTGTYELSTGTRVFAEEDLIAAKQALEQDPAVVPPRIKLGHLDPRDGFDGPELDGEPSLGWFDNFAIGDQGQTLTADAHVPEWLAAVMEWAYPSRSIEGTPPGWISASGQKHELVITAVSLLGIHWPGVTTLEDLQEVLANGPDLPAAAEGGVVLARMPRMRRPAHAGIDQDLIVRRFYDAVDTGDVTLPDGTVGWDLWVRSMRFDDQGQAYLKVTDEASGNLYRLDFTVKGSEVSWGEFVEVVEQDVPVSARSPRPSAPLATWGSRDESRALQARTEGPSMNDEQRRNLAKALGLPEDTDEAAIFEAAAKAEAPETPAEPETPAPEQPETPAPEEPATPQPETPETPAQPEAIAATGNVVTVSKEVWEQTTSRLGAVEAASKRRDEAEAKAHRDGLIKAALGDGRIAPSERDTWRTNLDKAPEATESLLASLTPGRVPVTEIGHSQTGEANATEDAEHDAFMARHFPSETQKLAAKAAGPLIRQEA